MAYGPDNNLPLNDNVAFTVTLPANALLRLSFVFEANWEQAIIVYGESGSGKVVEKGNYGRDKGDWVYINRSGATQTYRITGWHKRSRPNGNEPWYQSLGKVLRCSASSPELIGFEDNTDNDYNDAQCVVDILVP